MFEKANYVWVKEHVLSKTSVVFPMMYLILAVNQPSEISEKKLTFDNLLCDK